MIRKLITNQDNYAQIDKNGYYKASQPIYGFRADSPRNGLIINYIRAYQILRHLSQYNLKNKSIIDVGGGEGYTANLIRKYFKVRTIYTTDISKSACQRAKDIFGLKSKVADICYLPFKKTHLILLFAVKQLNM